jgi:hypothetical protein
MRIETMSAYRVALASHLFPSRLASCLHNPDRIVCLPTQPVRRGQATTVSQQVSVLSLTKTASLTILHSALRKLASIHRDVNLISLRIDPPSPPPERSFRRLLLPSYCLICVGGSLHRLVSSFTPPVNSPSIDSPPCDSSLVHAPIATNPPNPSRQNVSGSRKHA